MSATTSKPMTGHANQTAPLGTLAVLVGALALGAVGIALGQGYKPAPDTAVAARAALHEQRIGEIGAGSSSESALRIQRRGEIGAGSSSESALRIQRRGEIGAGSSSESALRIQRRGEIGGSAATFPSSISGPATGEQKIIRGPKHSGVVEHNVDGHP